MHGDPIIFIYGRDVILKLQETDQNIRQDAWMKERTETLKDFVSRGSINANNFANVIQYMRARVMAWFHSR